MDDNEMIVYHQPNWHPKLHYILGDIRGEIGYVTKYGTIELLGPLWENPNIPKTSYDTEDVGPTLLFSAEGSL